MIDNVSWLVRRRLRRGPRFRVTSLHGYKIHPEGSLSNEQPAQSSPVTVFQVQDTWDQHKVIREYGHDEFEAETRCAEMNEANEQYLRRLGYL
jgi:hypothetical protein